MADTIVLKLIPTYLPATGGVTALAESMIQDIEAANRIRRAAYEDLLSWYKAYNATATEKAKMLYEDHEFFKKKEEEASIAFNNYSDAVNKGLLTTLADQVTNAGMAYSILTPNPISLGLASTAWFLNNTIKAINQGELDERAFYMYFAKGQQMREDVSQDIEKIAYSPDAITRDEARSMWINAGKAVLAQKWEISQQSEQWFEPYNDKKVHAMEGVLSKTMEAESIMKAFLEEDRWDNNYDGKLYIPFMPVGIDVNELLNIESNPGTADISKTDSNLATPQQAVHNQASILDNSQSYAVLQGFSTDAVRAASDVLFFNDSLLSLNNTSTQTSSQFGELSFGTQGLTSSLNSGAQQSGLMASTLDSMFGQMSFRNSSVIDVADSTRNLGVNMGDAAEGMELFNDKQNAIKLTIPENVSYIDKYRDATTDMGNSAEVAGNQAEECGEKVEEVGGIADNMADALTISFDKALHNIGDFGKALQIGFGSALTVGIQGAIGKVFGGEGGTFMTAMSNVTKKLQGWFGDTFGKLFGSVFQSAIPLVGQALSGVIGKVGSWLTGLFTGPSNEELLASQGEEAGRIFGEAFTAEAQSVMERVANELPMAKSGKVDVRSAMLHPDTLAAVLEGATSLDASFLQTFGENIGHGVNTMRDVLGISHEEAFEMYAPVFEELVGRAMEEGVQLNDTILGLIEHARNLGVELDISVDTFATKISELFESGDLDSAKFGNMVKLAEQLGISNEEFAGSLDSFFQSVIDKGLEEGEILSPEMMGYLKWAQDLGLELEVSVDKFASKISELFEEGELDTTGFANMAKLAEQSGISNEEFAGSLDSIFESAISSSLEAGEALDPALMGMLQWARDFGLELEIAVEPFANKLTEVWEQSKGGSEAFENILLLAKQAGLSFQEVMTNFRDQIRDARSTVDNANYDLYSAFQNLDSLLKQRDENQQAVRKAEEELAKVTDKGLAYESYLGGGRLEGTDAYDRILQDIEGAINKDRKYDYIRYGERNKILSGIENPEHRTLVDQLISARNTERNTQIQIERQKENIKNLREVRKKAKAQLEKLKDIRDEIKNKWDGIEITADTIELPEGTEVDFSLEDYLGDDSTMVKTLISIDETLRAIPEKELGGFIANTGLFVLHAGEYVLNPDQVTALQGGGFLSTFGEGGDGEPTIPTEGASGGEFPMTTANVYNTEVQNIFGGDTRVVVKVDSKQIANEVVSNPDTLKALAVAVARHPRTQNGKGRS